MGQLLEFGSVSKDGTIALQGLSAALATINNITGQLRRRTAAPLKQMTRDITSTVTEIRHSVTGGLNAFNKGIETSESDLRNKVVALKQDVETINEIISQVVMLLESRLLALQANH